MTVAELIQEVSKYNPTDLITVDTNGLSRGIYPAGDGVDLYVDSRLCSHCVVLTATEWPKATHEHSEE